MPKPEKGKLNIRFDLGICGVELAGLEPATSCVQSRRSTRLSYSPVCSDNTAYFLLVFLVLAAL